MKSNPKQKAVYLALCILAAIVVWIFVDNFGNNGGAVMHTKWFRDVPITYTGETVLTERGFMLCWTRIPSAPWIWRWKGLRLTWLCWTKTISG